MTTFEELKQKAIEAAEVIADVSVDLYKKAEGKTKEFARTAKLQAENASDRMTVKKLYMEMGKLYYETHKLFPEPEFEQSCSEITALRDRIDARQAEIDAIKAEGCTVAEDADIEDVDDLPGDDSCDCDDDCCKDDNKSE